MRKAKFAHLTQGSGVTYPLRLLPTVLVQLAAQPAVENQCTETTAVRISARDWLTSLLPIRFTVFHSRTCARFVGSAATMSSGWPRHRERDDDVLANSLLVGCWISYHRLRIGCGDEIAGSHD